MHLCAHATDNSATNLSNKVNKKAKHNNESVKGLHCLTFFGVFGGKQSLISVYRLLCLTFFWGAEVRRHLYQSTVGGKQSFISVYGLHKQTS